MLDVVHPEGKGRWRYAMMTSRNLTTSNEKMEFAARDDNSLLCVVEAVEALLCWKTDVCRTS